MAVTNNGKVILKLQNEICSPLYLFIPNVLLLDIFLRRQTHNTEPVVTWYGPRKHALSSLLVRIKVYPTISIFVPSSILACVPHALPPMACICIYSPTKPSKSICLKKMGRR